MENCGIEPSRAWREEKRRKTNDIITISNIAVMFPNEKQKH